MPMYWEREEHERKRVKKVEREVVRLQAELSAVKVAEADAVADLMRLRADYAEKMAKMAATFNAQNDWLWMTVAYAASLLVDQGYDFGALAPGEEGFEEEQLLKRATSEDEDARREAGQFVLGYEDEA